jgi:hypothetical protein
VELDLICIDEGDQRAYCSNGIVQRKGEGGMVREKEREEERSIDGMRGAAILSLQLVEQEQEEESSIAVVSPTAYWPQITFSAS